MLVLVVIVDHVIITLFDIKMINCNDPLALLLADSMTEGATRFANRYGDFGDSSRDEPLRTPIWVKQFWESAMTFKLVLRYALGDRCSSE